jgi:porin
MKCVQWLCRVSVISFSCSALLNVYCPNSVAFAASKSKRWYEMEQLTGDWNGRRKALADQGVSPYASWNSQVTSNLDGGLRTGTDADGVVEFGVNLDFEKMGVWKGASFHTSAFWIQGNDDPSADYIGNFNEVCNLAARRTVRLYQAYLKKDFPSGKLSAKIGQLTLDDDFMTTTHSSMFVNASFGPLPTQSGNMRAPIYPLGALGVWAQVNVTKASRLQIGIYDGDAGTQTDNRHGFDYSLSARQGAVILAEADLDGAIAGTPGTYKLGTILHTGEFTDYRSGAMRSGNYALYMVIDQVLVGSREASTMGIFLRSGISQVADRNVVDWYFDSGLTARGLRDNDLVGIGFLHSSFGRAFIDSQLSAGTPVTEAESVIELSYQTQLTPWCMIQPDLQYVIDPQNMAAHNACVAALRMKITF